LVIALRMTPKQVRTGMRPSQLNRLRRSDIDISHATVFVPAAKGGRSNPIAAVGVNLR
jgi:integrase